MSKGVGFQPNFSCEHTVVLSRPLSEVFTVIGTAEGHERVCRLSKLCTQFELLAQDNFPLPNDEPLSDAHVRRLPASAVSEENTRSLPRQAFTMTETVPLLFGLFKNNVHLSGTLTWDEDAKLALYETESDTGIRVWKLRTFEEVDANTTKVTERIEGLCPKWLRQIVQREASKGHSEHLSLYHTLFQ